MHTGETAGKNASYWKGKGPLFKQLFMKDMYMYICVCP